MTMQNPITKEVFEEVSAYVESLTQSYLATKRQQDQFEQDEADLLALLDAAAGLPGEKRGTFKLEGTQHEVKIIRKENASYPRDKGVEHPLRSLLTVHQELLTPMINVDYKESGSEIQKFMDRMEHPEVGTADERALYHALKSVRIVKPGKPGIEIKELKKPVRG